ncbi:hypothetical protein [Nocardia cyriacigeorgica]|uniref:hypothetical protein n=1 Tax=Nocardia cyriacigeorgica TaxID=135487 RepID=UPI002457C15A|nr:hypothetical protein [Nocardia cyriacigeorgica]
MSIDHRATAASYLEDLSGFEDRMVAAQIATAHALIAVADRLAELVARTGTTS